MTDQNPKSSAHKPRANDAAGDTEGGMAEGSAGGPDQGNSLKDASREAVSEAEKREGSGHAGAGDIG